MSVTYVCYVWCVKHALFVCLLRFVCMRVTRVCMYVCVVMTCMYVMYVCMYARY